MSGQRAREQAPVLHPTSSLYVPLVGPGHMTAPTVRLESTTKLEKCMDTGRAINCQSTSPESCSMKLVIHRHFSQTFSLKAQRVNISDFEGYMASVATTQLDIIA